MYELPKHEKACSALCHLRAWVAFVASDLHHSWQSDDLLFPMLKNIPRHRKKDLLLEKPFAKSYEKVAVKWGTPMPDNAFIELLNVVADSAKVNRTIMGEPIWFTAHCFRRGGAQYRFMFAPPDRRWSLKHVKWWAAWSPGEKTETILKYLLDDVMDREEAEMSNLLAPDKSIALVQQGQVTSEINSESPSDRTGLKDEMRSMRQALDRLHTLVQDIYNRGPPEPIQGATGEPITEVARPLLPSPERVSTLPDAKSWQDYVHQFWNADPAKHQYRAGVDFTAEERACHKSRVSRMKLIAEFVRDTYGNDIATCESALRESIDGELTVNKICKWIRQVRKRHETA